MSILTEEMEKLRLERDAYKAALQSIKESKEDCHYCQNCGCCGWGTHYLKLEAKEVLEKHKLTVDDIMQAANEGKKK